MSSWGGTVVENWSGVGDWPPRWVTYAVSGGKPKLVQANGFGRASKGVSAGVAALVIEEEGAVWVDSDQYVGLLFSASLVRAGLVARCSQTDGFVTGYGCEVGSTDTDRLRLFRIEDGARITIATAKSNTQAFVLAKNVTEVLAFKVEQVDAGTTRLTATLRSGQSNAVVLSVLDTSARLQHESGMVGLWTGVDGSGFERHVAFSHYVGPEIPPTTRYWSEPASWPSGQVPLPGSAVVVIGAKPMVLDVSVNVESLRIEPGAELVCDATRTIQLLSDGNVEVYGVLRMRPASPSVRHGLQFVGADESAFVGGGMMVRATDVGLWVMGSGQLDLEGSPKTAWLRALSIRQGDSVIHLERAPVGWQVGDELVIAPSSDAADPNKPNNGSVNSWGQFESCRIVSVSGSSITIDKMMVWPHPEVTAKGRTLGPEILNLTRNVAIEGAPPVVDYPRTGGPKNNPGRAHIFVHTDTPVKQRIKRVVIRYMGPRKAVSSKASTDVLGRYGVHFHHCMDTSRGSVVQDTVVRDCGSHAFVPHASHGIMMCRCIAYNTTETPFWWDAIGTAHDTRSDDTMWLDDVAAKTRCDGADHNLNGFLLGAGKGNMAIRCVGVGGQGSGSSAAYHWTSQANDAEFNVWRFEGCVAHNNRGSGGRVWQNDSQPHEIEDFFAYHNFAIGVDQGAYRNPYVWDGVILVANGLDGEIAHAQWVQHNNSKAFGIGARGQGQAVDVLIEARGKSAHALLIPSHGLPPEHDTPWLMRRWEVSGCTAQAIVVNESLNVASGQNVFGLFDLVDWTVDGRELEISDFLLLKVNANSRIRVQRGNGTAFEIWGSPGGVVIQAIAPFWPYT